jgi:hypothetical protein
MTKPAVQCRSYRINQQQRFTTSSFYHINTVYISALLFCRVFRMYAAALTVYEHEMYMLLCTVTLL